MLNARRGSRVDDGFVLLAAIVRDKLLWDWDRNSWCI